MRHRFAVAAAAALFVCFFANWAKAAQPSETAFVRASSATDENAPHAAIDGDATTAWCAAPASQGDWIEFEFAPRSLGAIHMRSGLSRDGRLVGHKIRELSWSYRTRGSSHWRRIQKASGKVGRYQLIFRFAELRDVVALKLEVGPRSAKELQVTGHNNPCLREVALFDRSDAAIATQPWYYLVSTWEEGASVYAPLKHYDWRAFHVEEGLRSGLLEIAGKSPGPDFYDELWIGELTRENTWLEQEPAPSGFLLSGNYKDYHDVDARVFQGFYEFMRDKKAEYPMLGACGGHQLMAMAVAHKSLEQFNSEFSPDHPDQVVVTCSSVAAYKCNGRSAKDCCYEGGFERPFKLISANVAEHAIANRYQSPRRDMLFNLLRDDSGFRSYLFHSDFVNPEKIAPHFDIIATYPKSARALGPENPSLVQAMKLKGHPVYGTQFHFDENHAGQCGRDEGFRNMERLLKNFVLISLNRLNPVKGNFKVTSAQSSQRLRNLFDLDRATHWCTESDERQGSFVLELERPMVVSKILVVEGTHRIAARMQRLSLETSLDGVSWQPLPHATHSLHSRQHSCGEKPGNDDGVTFLLEPTRTELARFLRVSAALPSYAPWKSACLSELFLFEL